MTDLYCPECGAEVSEDDTYCPNCGYGLEEDVSGTWMFQGMGFPLWG